MPKSGKSLVIPLTLVSILLGLIAFSSGASAHVPIYSSGGHSYTTALRIPNSSVSYATYAEFEGYTFAEIQFYSITAASGQIQYIELDVPTGYESLAPVLLFIGPGLSEPDESTDYVLTLFGLELSSGQGALSWNYSGPLDEKEFEPFTQEVLLKRQSVNVTLSESGTYFIAAARIIPPFGPNYSILIREAKYILVTGTEEKFTVLDYILIPYDWFKGHLFWNENPLIFLLPTYVITFTGLALVAFMRRSRPTSTAVGPDRKGQAIFYSAIAGGLLMFAGGVNQLVFLFGNPLFSLGVGETIVLILQGIGIVLGVIAVRLAFSFLKPAKWLRVFVAAAIFVIALVVGAGFIVGPILFFAGAVLGTLKFRSRAKPALD